MKFKPNYIIIPLITIMVAVLGSVFTGAGMEWYQAEILKPDLTPPNWAFPIAWNLIFILTTIAVLIIWNKGDASNKLVQLLTDKPSSQTYWWIIGLFIANAVLNIGWTLLFFNLQMVQAALVEMILLEATLVALIAILLRYSRLAAMLLLPYTIWVGFATYLTYAIWIINY
jgi:translocator protein